MIDVASFEMMRDEIRSEGTDELHSKLHVLVQNTDKIRTKIVKIAASKSTLVLLAFVVVRSQWFVFFKQMETFQERNHRCVVGEKERSQLSLIISRSIAVDGINLSIIWQSGGENEPCREYKRLCA